MAKEPLHKQKMTDVYCATLQELARTNPGVMVLEADLMRVSGTRPFLEEFPERTVQVGVAEANMVGVAAGLAEVGLIPFCATFTTFAARRVFDVAFISVGLARLNVKIVGVRPGVTMETDGATHMCFEDLAMYRLVPGLSILCPGDAYELREVVKWMAATEGPMYLQLIRNDMPQIFGEDYRFEPGRAVVLNEGGDVTLVSTSFMTATTKEAVGILAAEGIHAAHLHYPTLKPFDAESLVGSAAKTGAVVTAENQSIFGGLGGSVAEVLSEQCPTPLRRIGIHDHYGEVGKLDYLMEKFGLTAQDIAKAARDLVKDKTAGSN